MFGNMTEMEVSWQIIFCIYNRSWRLLFHELFILIQSDTFFVILTGFKMKIWFFIFLLLIGILQMTSAAPGDRGSGGSFSAWGRRAERAGGVGFGGGKEEVEENETGIHKHYKKKFQMSNTTTSHNETTICFLKILSIPVFCQVIKLVNVPSFKKEQKYLYDNINNRYLLIANVQLKNKLQSNL